MTQLYSILKASKLGAGAAPDMYTALFAQKIKGGSGGEAELSGVPPLTFTADGTPLLDCLISGNMIQSGTPTPDNPVMPQGTGERTGNLVDYTVSESGTITSTGVLEPNPSCWRSTIYYEIDETKIYRASKVKDTIRICYYDSSKTFISREQITVENNKIITIPSGAKYIKWTLYATAGLPDLDAVKSMKIMLSEGAEIIPYEPFGVKIPISSASVTTPIYLGEVQTTRKMKKWVLDGTEDWRSTSGRIYLDTISDDYIRASGVITCVCTHYSAQEQVGSASRVNEDCITLGSDPANQRLYVYDTNISTTANFKSYLAAQYAAGTPVTVWYVLTAEKTAVVNEPLMKIGDYADTVSKAQAGVSIPTNNGSTTVDVDTTVKPSEVYIKYHTK